MVHTHQHSCEESMTRSLPQEAETIQHGPSYPQKILQLHHWEYPDWLHHHLVWQLLGIRPQDATEGSVVVLETTYWVSRIHLYCSWLGFGQWEHVISSWDQLSKKLIIISFHSISYKTACPSQIYTLLSGNINILTIFTSIIDMFAQWRTYRPSVCDRFVILKGQQR
jgi:hypothetical protein